MSVIELTESELNHIFCYSYLRCANDPQFYIALHQQFEDNAADFLNFCSSNDLQRQQIMIEVATSSLLQINYSGNKRPEINQLARAFTDLGIILNEKVINVWLDSLLGAVAEVDPQYDDLTLAAWRKSFSAGITLFQACQQISSAPQQPSPDCLPTK